MRGRPPRFTLFPYTTLFRSQSDNGVRRFVRERTRLDEGSVRGSRLQQPETRWSRVARVSDFPDPDDLLAHTAHRPWPRSEEHTSELQSQSNLVCRLLLEKKK